MTGQELLDHIERLCFEYKRRLDQSPNTVLMCYRDYATLVRHAAQPAIAALDIIPANKPMFRLKVIIVIDTNFVSTVAYLMVDS